ncbi:MAG: hypothetical protein EOP56_16780 [Sphingobacteriales bacterium]|nr:MAG: hypothetical protein EOP56_16780 [Sphingobacteriales bacterium]
MRKRERIGCGQLQFAVLLCLLVFSGVFVGLFYDTFFPKRPELHFEYKFVRTKTNGYAFNR